MCGHWVSIGRCNALGLNSMSYNPSDFYVCHNGTGCFLAHRLNCLGFEV